MAKLIPLPKLLKKAQDKFNAHIRERDKELGCISCGAEVQQAGHYFSQGQYSALRFALPHDIGYFNTNGQCIRCNMYLSGNLIKYRFVSRAVKYRGFQFCKYCASCVFYHRNKLEVWLCVVGGSYHIANI